MCDGSIMLKGFKWAPLVEAAKGKFKDVPKKMPGVYCLRVQHAPRMDFQVMVKSYLQGRLLKAMEEVDKASLELLRKLGLTETYQWHAYEEAERRFRRLERIRVPNNRLECPILYFGCSNNIWRRIDELPYAGHTINHAVWALLEAGWELEIWWKEEEHYKSAEQKLKEEYSRNHGDPLPPLMDS